MFYFKCSIQVSGTMNRVIEENEKVAETLDIIYRMNTINTIKNNLSDLITSGILTIDQASQVRLRYSLV